MLVQNSCQKWKEHDEISKIANFETAVAKSKTCDWKVYIQIEFSNYYKISHLNNSGLNNGNLTNFIMFFSFLATILYHHHFYD